MSAKPIGYYNPSPAALSFNTRFGPIFLEPMQIVRSNTNALVPTGDIELDAKVRQGLLRFLHEGESESTLFFRPVKKAPVAPSGDKVVITSQGGAAKPPAPPTVRVSAQVPPTNVEAPKNPTIQQLVEAKEAPAPTTARVVAADRAVTGPVVDEAEESEKTPSPAPAPVEARKVSDVIQVTKAGIPLDAVNNQDGTIAFEGNSYMSTGALIKFIEASGRPTKVVEVAPAPTPAPATAPASAQPANTAKPAPAAKPKAEKKEAAPASEATAEGSSK